MRMKYQIELKPKFSEFDKRLTNITITEKWSGSIYREMFRRLIQRIEILSESLRISDEEEIKQIKRLSGYMQERINILDSLYPDLSIQMNLE